MQILINNYKENTARAEPLAKAESRCCSCPGESYIFYQDEKNAGPIVDPAFCELTFIR